MEEGARKLGTDNRNVKFEDNLSGTAASSNTTGGGGGQTITVPSPSPGKETAASRLIDTSKQVRDYKNYNFYRLFSFSPHLRVRIVQLL